MWPDPVPASPSPATQLGSHRARVRLATELARDFPHAHVAALVDADGAVVDGVILHEAAHTIDHAVGFAACLASLHAPAVVSRSILFSVVGAAHPVRDADLARWRGLGHLHPFLPDLVDWLIADGTVVRSMRRTVGSM